MKDFSKKITEKIREDCIVPDSKFKTHWKNCAFWGIFSLIVLLGALFFSLVIINVIDLRPGILRHLELRRFLFLIFVTMPYLWMALLLITIFSGFMIFRKTKRGYRYNILFISGVVVLSISILGVLAHFSNINSRIDRGIPGPDKFVRPMEGRWQRPDDGLLGGEIIEVESITAFLIKTREGENWKVLYSDDTEIKKNVKIEIGGRIGMIGEKKKDRVFEAFIIMQPPFNKIRVKGEAKNILPRCFHNRGCPQSP